MSTYKKISELANVSTIFNTDLIEISKNMGGSSWNSYGLNFKGLKNSIYSNKVIFVTTDASGDASTLKDAMAMAAGMSPSESNPIIIVITPGIYNEDNPIQMIPWVIVDTWGSSSSNVLVADNTDQPLILGCGHSSIRGIQFNGAYQNGGTALTMAQPGTIKLVRCSIRDCDTGILITNSESIVVADTVDFIKQVGSSGRIGIAMTAGYMDAFAFLMDAEAGAGTFERGIRLNGAEATLRSCEFRQCDKGICTNNGGVIDVFGSRAYDCGTAVHVGNAGSNSTITMLGSEIEDSLTYNFNCESPTGKIRFQGLSTTTSSNAVNLESLQTEQLDVDDDRLFVRSNLDTPQSLFQGTPGEEYGFGYYSQFGEGGDYVFDALSHPAVEFWQYNNSASSGSKFTEYVDFAGTQPIGDGDAIIVGCKYPFAGCDFNILSAVNVGASNLVMDYWNGASWVECSFCGYNWEDIDSRGRNIFEDIESQIAEVDRTVGVLMNSSIDVLDQIPNWTVGLPMYAVRIRNNGALVTGATFDGGAAGANGISIDADSNKMVNWGNFRSDDSEIIFVDRFTPSATNPPSAGILNISNNVSMALENVVYPQATKAVSSIAYVLRDNIDTASPLKISVAFKLSANPIMVDTQINFKIIVTPIVVGNTPTILDGNLPEIIYNATAGISHFMPPNLLFTASAFIDISEYSIQDSFCISVMRDPTDPLNLYPEDVDFIGAFLTYGSKVQI